MGVGAAIAAAGVATAGASLISSKNAASAAQSAANTQAQASDQAAADTMSMYNQNVARVQPWVTAGQQALNTLQGVTGTNSDGTGQWWNAPLTKPFQPTMDQLSQTPGYQFTLQQGEEAAQNGYAAQGLGASGAALKGGINYAEGLAGTTYQQQFQNYLTQNQQTFNMLDTLAGSGQNAATQQAALGSNAQAQSNALTTSGAAASAAGTVGAANATNAGISGVAGSLGNAGLLYALNSGNPNNGLTTNYGSPATNQLINAPGTAESIGAGNPGVQLPQ